MTLRKDQAWRDASLANRYLEGVRGAIPFAEEQIGVLLRLIAASCPRLKNFLDLGCGDGVLGRAVLNQHPDARGVFADFSEPMLAAARQRLGTSAPRHAVILCDYGEPEWIEALGPEPPFDVVVSGFSIHHQPDERKQELYWEIFQLLGPGGIFLNLEHVASRTPWGTKLFDEHFIDSLDQFHRQNGGVKLRVDIATEYYYRPDKAANILAPVEEQCDWLREIGFADVDCYFKLFELALFAGRRP